MRLAEYLELAGDLEVRLLSKIQCILIRSHKLLGSSGSNCHREHVCTRLDFDGLATHDDAIKRHRHISAVDRPESPTAARATLSREEELIICREVQRKLTSMRERIGA